MCIINLTLKILIQAVASSLAAKTKLQFLKSFNIQVAIAPELLEAGLIVNGSDCLIKFRYMLDTIVPFYR